MAGKEFRVKGLKGLDNVIVAPVAGGKDIIVPFSGNKPKKGTKGQIIGGRFNPA